MTIHHRICYAPLLLLLISLLAIPSAVTSSEIDSDLTYFIVKFRDYDTTREPYADDAVVCLPGMDKSMISINALSSLAILSPVIRRGTPHFSPEGPWRIGLFRISNPESLLAEIRNDPHVLYADMQNAEPDTVIGDRGATPYWPNLPSKPRFCDTQTQLHARRAGQDTLSGELCSYEVGDWTHDGDMDLPQAWAITRGDSNVVVAVIDIGTDWTHPALGGPGPAQAVPDSLPFYNQGVIFRNWQEQLGDANCDGYPGIHNVDDDGDGLIDEDSAGREPDNTQESDVILGTISSVQDTTITDSCAHWTPNEHVGHYLYGNTELTFYALIVANTDTTITTRMVPTGYGSYIYWSYLTHPGMQYRIGNRTDDDNDGDIDDVGYLGDLINDDDENGYNDDLRGYDFYDNENVPVAKWLPNEDYADIDNDPRSVGDHGTAVASQVATSSAASMMSIAPNVKILPIRGGAYYKHETNLCGAGTWDITGYTAGFAYARQMGVDMIVTATDGALYGMIEQARLASRDGILHFNGTSGGTPTHPHSWAQSDSSMLVAGVDWYDECHDSGIGAWVDISAKNTVYVATTSISCPSHIRYGYGTYTSASSSLCGPQAAAVAALMKSAYPQWELGDIRNKLLTSVDNIYAIPEDPYLNMNYIGMLGSGRINAYKALTLYGKVGTQSPDTTWTNKVWISGDIEVPHGATLHIAPGCTLYMAQDDILDKGISANRCEIVVKGKISFEGTEACPVVVDMLRDADSSARWGPIVFDNDVSRTHGVFQHVIFRHAILVARKGDLPISERVNVRFDHCAFDDVTSAVDMRGLALGDTVELLACTMRGTGPTAGVGLYAEAASGDGDYVLSVGDDTRICNFLGGLNIQGHATATVAACAIDSCSYGVLAYGVGATGPVIGPEVEVSTMYGLGIHFQYGQPTIRGCSVANAGTYGVSASGGARVIFETPTTNIIQCGMHGVVVDGIASNTVIQNLAISECGNSGIRVKNCSPVILGPVSIESCDNAAIYCDAASPVIDAVTMTGNSVGLNATNSSAPYLRNSSIANGEHAVIAGESDAPSIGTYNDYGYNEFSSISGYYGTNFNNNAVLMMLGNCYNGSTNPKASKFGGSNTTQYTPGVCQ